MTENVSVRHLNTAEYLKLSKAKITGPLFKWFGSKWLSSKTLPQPKYDTIVEPFAGGAGYSLRHCEKQVIICESDFNVWSLWEWLINFASYNPCAVREIPLNVPVGTDIKSLGLTTGQEMLLKHWQRTNNVGNCWTISPWGNKPGQWTESTRSRVADQVQYVRHWRLGKDYRDVIHMDTPCYTWLIDPPYQYNYQYQCKPINYTELGARCEVLNGQVIACEAVCPKTGIVPNWLPFKHFGDRITSRRKEGYHTYSKELIYER